MKDAALRSVEEEVGCLRFDVWQDASDASCYHLYEVYTDEAAFEVSVDGEPLLRATYVEWMAALGSVTNNTAPMSL